MLATAAETPGQGLSGRAVNLLPISLGLGTLIVAFAVAFLPSIQWVLAEWAGSSGVLSHGYLVAAISVYLFARAIPEVSPLPLEPMWWALPALLGLSITWLLGYASTVIAVQTIVLPGILLLAITVTFGKQIARRFAFPILFLYLAMPALEHLKFIFQAITVSAVSILVRIADLPALIDGTFVVLPQGMFQIAGGCSGLNFIVAGLSLAIFYGHLFYTTARQNAQLVVLTMVVAMAGNWIRVFTIIVIGYRTNMQSPMVDDHMTFGWILFAILMIPVYVVAGRIESSDDVPTVRRLQLSDHRSHDHSVNWIAVVVATIVMITGPVWANTISKSKLSATVIGIDFPEGRSGWAGPNVSHWGWQPEFAGTDAEAVAEYRLNSEIVLAYANVYLSQEQDRELVYFSNDIVGGWRVSSIVGDLSDVVTLESGGEYRQSVASNYIGDWLIWYRYQHGDKFDVSAGQAKISQAIQTLSGNPDAGIMAFATPCREECLAASNRLTNFVTQIGNSINLDNVREQP